MYTASVIINGELNFTEELTKAEIEKLQLFLLVFEHGKENKVLHETNADKCPVCTQ